MDSLLFLHSLVPTIQMSSLSHQGFTYVSPLTLKQSQVLPESRLVKFLKTVMSSALTHRSTLPFSPFILTFSIQSIVINISLDISGQISEVVNICTSCLDRLQPSHVCSFVPSYWTPDCINARCEWLKKICRKCQVWLDNTVSGSFACVWMLARPCVYTSTGMESQRQPIKLQ